MSDEALLVLDDYLEECYMQGDSTMKKDQKDALIVAMRCLCPTSRFARRQIEDDLTSTEQVLQMLDEIEWKDSDPESWKNLSWP